MKAVAVGRSRLPIAIGRDELGVGVERHEVHWSPTRERSSPSVTLPLLLPDEGPNLVDLDAAAGQAAHRSSISCCAAVADLDQKPHDRVAVRAGHALRRADRVALDQSS